MGFSQEKLAGLLGLTFQQVQKYERDDRTFVDVKPLDTDARYVELDRMIGGGSDYSRLHAIELINESNKFKNK